MSDQDKPPKEVILPLLWRVDETGDSVLMAGAICVGEVFWIPRFNQKDWKARGKNICMHRSDGHATREAAQKALENAVLALAEARP